MRTLPAYFFIIPFIILQAFYASAQKPREPNKLYPILFNYARNLYEDYNSSIPMERRFVLDEIADYIIGSSQFEGEASLVIIGSNNSTRSILAEAWAKAAAYYYGISNIHVFSGGLNISSISTNAVIALEKAGFIVYKTRNGQNPPYEIKYSYNIPPVYIQSKKHNDTNNPKEGYGIIVVCPNADSNLSAMKGNNFRTSLYYFDPRAYDLAEDSLDQYLLRSREIATEMFYIFYRLKNAK
ncbi:MAG: hypothetical protein KFF73_19490 [Cyclobacteriaceae bacterium]|nr:hypothetical protein [Cyclobacteriaceae bacterium]